MYLAEGVMHPMCRIAICFVGEALYNLQEI
jgi:hypothetical protein